MNKKAMTTPQGAATAIVRKASQGPIMCLKQNGLWHIGFQFRVLNSSHKLQDKALLVLIIETASVYVVAVGGYQRRGRNANDMLNVVGDDFRYLYLKYDFKGHKSYFLVTK